MILDPVFFCIPEYLDGVRIRLIGLQETHFGDLIALGMDARIWAHFPIDLSVPTRHFRHLQEIFEQVQRGICHAFAIVNQTTGYPVGMTRLFNVQPQNRQGEIGSWLAPAYWQNGMNMEAKFLLLQYCFEELHLLRVQFRTDTRNLQSRKALEKLGAHFEGIVRKERILENGTVRDAALYSILDSEWSEVKQALLDKVRPGSRSVPLFS